MKRQTTNGKKMFATSVTDKGQVSGIYEELLPACPQEKDNPIEKQGKDVNVFFPSAETECPTS